MIHQRRQLGRCRAFLVLVISILTAVGPLAASPISAVASASSNLYLSKSVASASLAPALTVTLAVNKPDAIPGDALTYSATVTNTGATVAISGVFTAKNADATTGQIASYYDYAATSRNDSCIPGSNHGHNTAGWTPLGGSAGSQVGYTPVQPSPISGGLTLTATPIPADGVTYPSSGDRFLGTQVAAGAMASWRYTASLSLSPSQVGSLLDRTLVTEMRNTFHAEMTPRLQSGNGQPDTVDTVFCQLVQPGVSGDVTGAQVVIARPTGTAATFDSTTTPALADLRPGASVTVTAPYTVPLVPARGGLETDAAYLIRLKALSESTLSARATASGSTYSGTVSATPVTVATTEHLPIVTVTKTGPAAATTGTTVTYSLALQNSGRAPASDLGLTDTVGGSAAATVTGVPTAMAPAASVTATATYAIPGSAASGDLVDKASVVWHDANGNFYGPLTSSLTTVVSSTVSGIAPISTTTVQGNFFAEPAGTSTFVAKPGDTPAFGQRFPNIDFNPPAGTINHNVSGVDPTTRPFTDVTTDLAGSYAGTIPAQGNGVQAGVGTLQHFNAVFTGSFVVTKPGDVTFNVVADDGFLLGIANGATRVSGAYENVPATNQSAFNSYPLVGATNNPGNTTPGTYPVTVHFAAAGTFPYEIDYFSCCQLQLSLTLTIARFTADTSPLSVYVGYADGLRPAGSIFPFPWQGSPGVNFIGNGNTAYDAGAIRLDNNSDNPITLDDVSADVASSHFDLWGSWIVLPPHQITILTQTNGNNLDTSDYPVTCTPTGVIPQVHLVQAGVTTSFADTTQVLNTGGIDPPSCGRGNESISWTRIGGGGMAINVPLPPAATLALTPAVAGPDTVGQPQAFKLAAMDGNGAPVASLPITLQVFGANTQQLQGTTDASGLVTLTYVGLHSGTDTITGTGFVSGFQNVSNAVSLEWDIPVPGGGLPGGTAAQAPPSITSASPVDGAVVTKPVPISATFTPPAGQSITAWSVSYQALDPEAPVTIASGTGTPPATLATFDPTLLPNDTYLLTITATSSGGGTQTLAITVSVAGDLKLGRYTTTYQDLSVPVNGFQMEVRRTYDSYDKRVGDFGVGWKVSVANFRTSTNRQLGAGGWTLYPTQCIFGLCYYAFKSSAPHFVTISWPDGHDEIFDWTPSAGAALFYWQGSSAFTARPDTGTTSKLEDAGDPGVSYDFAGNIDGAAGVYNPTRFKLTTKDGRVLILDSSSGLVSETDRSGNSLAVDPSGVHASNGQSISFARDAVGRITGITGPSSRHLSYTYSSGGDLASSTDPDGRVTNYIYTGNHLLSSIAGNGLPPQSTLTYGSDGRLVSITDGSGNTTTLASNVGAQQQTVTDAAGRRTQVSTFDDLGDVVRLDEVADGTTLTTTHTYDAQGRQLSATDPAGDIYKASYDAAGNLSSYTDASGKSMTVAYDALSNPITTTDPNGHVTSFGYDAAGNLTTTTDALGHSSTASYDGSAHQTGETDARGGATSMTYDSQGRQATRVDQLHRSTSYAYDSSNRLNGVTDPLGHTASATYDGDGHITSVTDAAGDTVSWSYDALGRTISRSDGLHQVTTYAYDGAGHLASMTDPLGHSTTYSYDADGRLVSVTDPAGAVSLTAYDGHGRVASTTDALGNVTSNGYDAAGRLTRRVAPNGGVQTYTYDGDGRVTSATDPLGHITRYAYDAGGRLITNTDPTAAVQAYAYDALGQLTDATDALGHHTSLSYDAGGNLLTVTDPMGGVIHHGYDAGGQLISNTDATGRTSTYTYDLAGQLSAIADPAGNATTATYDAAGRQIATRLPSGVATSFTYDSADRLTKVTDALGNAIGYGYDAAGRKTAQTDALGKGTHYAYDSAGRQTAVTDPLGGIAAFSYDLNGRLVSATDPVGHATAFAYDEIGDLVKRTDPSGNVVTASYDAAARQASQTNARGNLTTYAYDAADRLTSAQHPGGTDTFTYDAAGRRTALANATGTTTLAYDNADRLTTSASPQGTVGYTYDAAGRRTSMAQPGGHSATYAYDPAGRPASLTDGSGATTAFSLNADGQITGIARPNGVSTTNAYDAAGRLSRVSHAAGSTAIDSFQYTLDANGNRTAVASNSGTESYNLDANQRLTKVTYGDASSESYTYDAAGNRMTQTTALGTTSYGYDAGGKLVSAGSTAYTYDADGNQVSAGTSSYGYDWNNRLSNATVGGQSSSFTYNADGQRVGASGGTTGSYLWDTVGGLPEVASDGSTAYLRGPPGDVIAQQPNGGPTAYPLADGLGSSRYITDSTGAIAGSSSYSAFGGRRTQSGQSSIFGFAGEQTDTTGLQYLRSRFYDSSTGRFLSRDTRLQGGPGTPGLNPYTYGLNNPSNLTDPTGHGIVEYAFNTLRSGVIGAGIGGGIGAVTCPHDQNWSECEGKQILLGLLAGLAAGLVPGGGFVSSCAAGAAGGVVADSAGQALAGHMNGLEIFKQGVIGCAVGAATHGAGRAIKEFGGRGRASGEVALPKATDGQSNGLGPERTAAEEGTAAAVNGETAATAYGRDMHTSWDFGPGFKPEFSLRAGGRVDAINFETREIVELKPNNPRAIRLGNKQLDDYIAKLNEQFPGDPWTGRIVTYDRP